MPHPAPRRVLARLLTVLLVAVLAPVTGTAAAAGTSGTRTAANAVPRADTPLSVSISTLTPSTIPEKGRITVTGQITNNSDTTWRDLNVYMLTSSEPFTEQAELSAASRTDPAAAFGRRLTDAGLFESIGDLAPGSTTGYVLSVPRRALLIGDEPGVYWLGVHVLGTSRDGRDLVADGRARTFIPLMHARGPRTALSLVFPFKRPVSRTRDGGLADLDDWKDALGPDGRLSRLLQLSGTAQSFPLTWVVDPAVLDAVQSVAHDDPAMSIAPTDEEAGGDETSDGASSSTPSPSTSPSEDGEASEEPPEPSQAALDARAWLELFSRQALQRTVLAVPYGEPALATMFDKDFASLYRRARGLSTATMEELGLTALPVVAPQSGFLPSAVLKDMSHDATVLLADAAAPDATSTVIQTDSGHRIVLTDSATTGSSPGPTAPRSALAVRQRVLSEAALHALSEERAQPLVVATPPRWNPGQDWRNAQFFRGLSVRWLRPTALPLQGPAGGSLTHPEPRDDGYDGHLRYPRRLRRAELPLANLLATKELIGKGRTLAAVLSRNDEVDEFLAKSAMLASSTWARRHPRAAAHRVRGTTAGVRALLGRIEIDGPSFVTMSSEDGTFAVTLVNGLEEPAVVGIAAQTSGKDLDITSSDPVELGAGQRASVRLRVHSDEIGVHSVSLQPTTAEGEPFGESIRFNVRSSQVGIVIWVIMGLGAAGLLVAIAVRLTRRFQGRRRTAGRALTGSPAE